MARLQSPRYSQKSKIGITRYDHRRRPSHIRLQNNSYEFSHRLNAAKVYPLQAPNGSTIVVYGHEYGLSILWRGGRVPDDLVNAKPKAEADYGRFIVSEEELAGSKPYLPIIQQSHFTFGIAIQDIAFPPLSPRLLPSSIFAKSVIVAAVCADYNVRLVAVPLDPTQDSKEVTTIHLQSAPSSIAVTFVKASDDYDLLVASYCPDRVGKIVFSRVPVEVADHGLQFAGAAGTLHSIYTASPVTAIAFNSSAISTDHHTQLLVANIQGSVKVYDSLLPSPYRRKLARRGSGEESTIPSTGSWIGSFYTPFETPKGIDLAAPATTHRKVILDAAWASEGRSIVALLSDGEWGIWDIAGGGPGGFTVSSGKNTFAIHAFVHGNLLSSLQVPAAEPKQPRGKRSSLAPMTPNTRKKKQENLFRGPIQTTSRPTGGVSVQQMLSPSGVGVEDAVTFWYENKAYSIPSLRGFWGRVVKESGPGTGGSLYGPGLTRIEGVDVGGERMRSVSQLPNHAPTHSGQKDYLITGEHRIIFVESQLPRGPGRQLFSDESADTSAVDHSLLLHGELDIGGLDRMLDTMGGEEDVFMSGALNNTAKRKVGFTE